MVKDEVSVVQINIYGSFAGGNLSTLVLRLDSKFFFRCVEKKSPSDSSLGRNTSDKICNLLCFDVYFYSRAVDSRGDDIDNIVRIYFSPTAKHLPRYDRRNDWSHVPFSVNSKSVYASSG